MSEHREGTTRRTFLKETAFAAGAMALAGSAGPAAQGAAPPAQAGPPSPTAKWIRQMGLQSGSSRVTLTDKALYEQNLADVARIGYKEIEPWGGYVDMTPREFRAMLDRVRLTMPSTHSPATAGPDLERELEGFQIMGIKYTEVRAAGAGGGAGRGRGAPGGAPAAGAPRGAGAGPAGGRGAGQAAGQMSEAVKRTAALANANGKIAQKFGMKILVHNHTQEFAPLADNPQMTPFDTFLAETDPALVAMQLDIGWASIAGQDILGIFRKYPGRFELWHVKDAVGIKWMTPQMTQQQRADAAYLVPVGLGEVDYRTIFQSADLAGLKHFFVEQDNAGSWGDPVAAVRVSYNNLVRMLSSG